MSIRQAQAIPAPIVREHLGFGFDEPIYRRDQHGLAAIADATDSAYFAAVHLRSRQY